MDAARLAFRDASFDCVVCIEAAFHFDTRSAFLAEAFRVLRPGGVLFTTDMIIANPAPLGKWMVPVENDIGGVEAYIARLKDSGFQRVMVSDVTEQCWNAFCRERVKEAVRDRCIGQSSTEAFTKRKWYLEKLQECVSVYVFASAVKAVP
jgi:2-polyprenyl-3-methyl-5-hydroxy-6-metoxy-1,4-benzoquinol methylase